MITNLWMDLFEALDVTADQHCLEISQTSIKNWRLKKKQNLDIMGCWGWIKEAKKPSNPNLYLKIGARKVKRRKGFLEIGHSALTANFIDF